MSVYDEVSDLRDIALDAIFALSWHTDMSMTEIEERTQEVDDLVTSISLQIGATESLSCENTRGEGCCPKGDSL